MEARKAWLRRWRWVISALAGILTFLVVLLAIAAIPYTYVKYDWFVATNYYFTAVMATAGLLGVVAFATRHPNH